MKEQTLWKWFSLYIRLRDSDENGYCRCISCGRVYHYKEMDAGHYYSRNVRALKYDEKNVNAQCKHCNKWLRGNVANYASALVRKYGKDILFYFELRQNNITKINQVIIKALSDEYRLKAKAEGLKRGIKL